MYFIKAQPSAAAPAPPLIVVVNGLVDQIPDSYSVDDMSVDIEELFGRFRQWLALHLTIFANNTERVAAIKYVLSGTSFQWFNDIAAANMPSTLDELQRYTFAKFTIAKTRLEWKKELEQCKYIPGTSNLPMINKFQLYCSKLQWPLAVQIEKFVHILPMPFRQFVVSKAHHMFAEVTDLVRTYQELIKVDSVSHVFKNVLFNDVTLCNKSHKSLECPSLRSIIEMEVSSSVSPNSSSSDSHSCSPTCDYG